MSSEKKSKQFEYVEKEVYEGKSSNQIQKDLREHDMGMRRKVLLATIREIKGITIKPDRWKYVPLKYRHLKMLPKSGRPVSEERLKRAERRIQLSFSQKQITIAGTVNGRPHRIQIKGRGRDLYRVMGDIIRHPPKKRFLTTTTNKVLGELNYYETWDMRPNVNS